MISAVIIELKLKRLILQLTELAWAQQVKKTPCNQKKGCSQRELQRTMAMAASILGMLAAAASVKPAVNAHFPLVDRANSNWAMYCTHACCSLCGCQPEGLRTA
jgi:hypothetical protein